MPARSDTSPVMMAAASTKRVTLVGAPSSADGFCVGGIYTMEPENGTLSKPATLSLHYSAESAVGREPATFSIYHYDATDRVWTPVASSHDQATRTLTAQVTELGGYSIGCDDSAPQFALLLPSGTPAVVTTTTPELTVGCTEEGSGLVPATFAAALDGEPLEAAWSPAAQSAVVTVADHLEAGTHTLFVEGSDGAGNEGSASFEFAVSLPPGQAVLKLEDATSEQVDLQLEAGQSAAGAGERRAGCVRDLADRPGPGRSLSAVGDRIAGLARVHRQDHIPRRGLPLHRGGPLGGRCRGTSVAAPDRHRPRTPRERDDGDDDPGNDRWNSGGNRDYPDDRHRGRPGTG